MKIQKFILKYSNLLLFVVLLGFFILLPFLDNSTLSGMLLTSFFSLVLFLAVLTAGEKKKYFKIAIYLGFVTLVTVWWDSPHTKSGYSLVASKILFCIFFIFICHILLKRIFKSKKINENAIFGVACVYILMGLIWTMIYILINYFQPGSFQFQNGVEFINDVDSHEFLNLFYFSFVTITTLGYGDVIPISKIAKMCSILEAVIGQLFIAISVARIVGLYTAEQYQKNIEKDLSSLEKKRK